MFKKLLFVVFFFPTLSSADIVVDLTTPEAASFSEKYPEYEWMRLLSFADTGENLAITAFQISKDVDEFDLYIATISSSKKGKQKLYITIPDTCSEGDPKLDENTTIKTNEQNVMYLRFCDGKRVYLTPFSDAGNDFLINEFKTKKSVSFVFYDLIVIIDAAGFTEAWNSFGGDAL